MQSKIRSALLTALLAVATPAFAQSSGNGFLFGRPSGSFSIRGGYSQANAGSDLFSFTTNELTLDKNSFNGLTLGADVAFTLSPRLDLVLGASYAGTSNRSEFRHFVDNNNLPIEQNTDFVRAPITASLKYYLAPHGRSLGSFAWIPTKFSPFLGAGAGVMYYRFSQAGDFVDFRTNGVFNQSYASSGWAPTAHGLAGFDYSLSPRLSLTTEARYAWAKADLGRDYSGFKPIDLSGLSTTVGIYVRF